MMQIRKLGVMRLGAVLLFAAGCTAASPGVGSGAGDDGGAGDVADASPDLALAPDLAQPPFEDGDQDGLDDAQELAWAHDYLPYISHSPTEDCKVGGLLVRVRPHPDDAKL